MKWTDIQLTSAGQYMKLKTGENKIRIVSEVEAFGKHYDRENKKITICIGKDKGCTECEKGNKPRVQWLLWVIDRADGKIKLLEVGYSIILQISKLAQTKDYEFDIMPSYDMIIIKEGEGLDTEYTVIPARVIDVALTEKEKEEIMKLESPAKIIQKKKERLIGEFEDIVEEPF